MSDDATRIDVRPYGRGDLAAIAALFSDPDVVRYVGDREPLHADEAAAMLERIFEKYRSDPTFLVWAVEIGGAYAGHAELKRRAGRSEYEIVYLLARAFWGRGYGGALADLLIVEALDRDLEFIIATVDAENVASANILRQRGFDFDESLSRELGTPAYRLDLT